MKGLRKYLAKHGRHLTISLAKKATSNRWSAHEVESSSERIVYYNVTDSTLGDIIFLTNYYYDSQLPVKTSRIACVRKTLRAVEDINAKELAFDLFLTLDENLDLRKYL